MIGAIIGDIVGSRFEFKPIKSKDFELFTNQNRFTDDTVMTCAIAQALMDWIDSNKLLDLEPLFIKYMQEFGKLYPDAGYGGNFGLWIYQNNPQPYNSFGNGSAMRVSPVAWVANSLEQAQELAKISACVTHNHKEGIKGAVATATCIYLAKTKHDKKYIQDYVCKHFYDLNFDLDQIRKTYKFDVSCQGSVPQAIKCFLEAKDFEDCIRNSISLGGDSDTIAAIAGSIAQAYYPIDNKLKNKAFNYLDDRLIKLINKFEKYMSK